MDESTEQYAERPNKSEAKRQAQAHRALARRLVALSREQLADLPLDETIRDAIEEWHRIRSREAKRRQIQRLGKLLRAMELEPVQAAIDRLDHSSELAKAELHHAERWRERLLAEGDQAVQAFVAAHPSTQTQRLRQLIRNARREQRAGENTKAYRELFRLIREHIQLA